MLRHRNREFDDCDLPDDPPPRRRFWAHRCVCGPDLPGTCPGPAACPYSDTMDDEPELADQLEE